MRTILVLAANPKGTVRLRLDEEVARIEDASNARKSKISSRSFSSGL